MAQILTDNWHLHPPSRPSSNDDDDDGDNEDDNCNNICITPTREKDYSISHLTFFRFVRVFEKG